MISVLWQRRLNAAVYKNNFPVAINCHYVSKIPYIFFLSNFVFLVLQHFFFRRLILVLVDGS